MKHVRRFWLKVVIVSVAVQSVFCLQALAALAFGGCMVLGRFSFIAFYPHFMCVVFLCPDTMANYGLAGVGIERIGWPRYLGWLAAALPASFLYGIACVEAWRYIYRRKAHETRAA